ncbi:hypothetical protein DFH08DRAFT_972725 [Mycena albidolilacea]|uniref:Uncharacterized protein n=1 Tax=Mycena albidolilacea TaxID=1033008 RepID=A0AAD7EDU2_9AGAR|nr:hypothetical protein DFH08DRAFT_972725 [Mycena albidolilacea]
MTLPRSALVLGAVPSLRELTLHISISQTLGTMDLICLPPFLRLRPCISARPWRTIEPHRPRTTTACTRTSPSTTTRCTLTPCRPAIEGAWLGSPGVWCSAHVQARRAPPVPWLHNPASDGRSPSYGAPGLNILAFKHPGQTHLVPPRSAHVLTLPATQLPSPTSTSSASYTGYLSTPTVLPPSPSSLSPADLSSSLSSEEEEDTTYYSLPTLMLQTCRHMPHLFSSMLGLRGALGCVGCTVVWLVLVAVLAGRGAVLATVTLTMRLVALPKIFDGVTVGWLVA